MTDGKAHPMTIFLHERAEGNVAYNPSTDQDGGRHWICNQDRHGYTFDFVVHDRQGTLGFEIYAKNLDWIGRFIYHREIEYVDQPSEAVQNLIEDCVEIRDAPADLAEMRKRCSNCDSMVTLDVVPELELVVEGAVGQRVFEDSCPFCGEEMVQKETL